jgi:hypothetical protein
VADGQPGRVAVPDLILPAGVNRERPAVPLQEVYALVERALGDLGVLQQHRRLRALPTTQKVGYTEGRVRFFDHELRTSREGQQKVALERTRQQVRDLAYNLEARGGDPTFGFMPVKAVHRGMFANAPAHLGDYAVEIRWMGPVPETWPAPVVVGDVSDAEAEEAGREMEKDPQMKEVIENATKALTSPGAVVKREVEAQKKNNAARRKAVKQLHRRP